MDTRTAKETTALVDNCQRRHKKWQWGTGMDGLQVHAGYMC